MRLWTKADFRTDRRLLDQQFKGVKAGIGAVVAAARGQCGKAGRLLVQGADRLTNAETLLRLLPENIARTLRERGLRWAAQRLTAACDQVVARCAVAPDGQH